jgi:hypothetical protein
MRRSFFLPAILLCIFIISCRQQRSSKNLIPHHPEESIKAAAFSADSAYAFVEKQVSFGPRVPGSAAHERCAKWLTMTLNRYADEVSVQKFTMKAYNGQSLGLSNIVASFNPDNPARILLCAHWDSRPVADHDPDASKRDQPVDAANDGGSGVGILLEIARQMSLDSVAVGVDILLLDGEDFGAPQDVQSETGDDWALGSQYWSRNPHKPGYSARYGILLDMVGAEGAVFSQEETSLFFAPDIVKKVWSVASQIGYSSYFQPDRFGPITDDHVYINELRQIPTIDIIQHDPATSSGFYRNWHTTMDNLAGIDRNTLMAVGQTVITTVRSE